MSLITLLTDFGQSDVYVGVMKGTIAQINPQLKAIDLTHEISPQDLVAGRFCLMNAYPYFPQGTVHVAVVDPGVGSQRRAIALQLDEKPGFYVGPVGRQRFCRETRFLRFLGFLGASRRGSETGFLCRSRWGDRDFAEKPGFLAGFLSLCLCD
jgi:hypothetical protein